MSEELTKRICFMIAPSMYQAVQKAAERRYIKVSQLLRQLIRQFLMSEENNQAKSNEERDEVSLSLD